MLLIRICYVRPKLVSPAINMGTIINQKLSGWTKRLKREDFLKEKVLQGHRKRGRGNGYTLLVTFNYCLESITKSFYTFPHSHFF